MLNQLNDFMRSHCGLVHRTAKAMASTWINSASPRFPIVRSIHGKVLRLHPRFATADLEGIEPEVYGWMRSVLRAGDTALDVGANFGLHSMYMAKLVGDGGKVFAFEPSPANARILKYHSRVNRTNHVQLVNRAVSDRDCESIPFFLLNDGLSPSNSLTFGRSEVPNLDRNLLTGAIPVESVTIDGFCRTTGVSPALIKIDIEGAELLALQGAAATLATNRPRVILAVHPWWLPPGQTTQQIVELLTSLRYRILDHSRQPTAQLEYSEYLCEPAA
jgi:FkbM family methyltransferase